MKRIVLLFFVLLFVTVVHAQQNRIRINGKVTDANSGESLPSVNIILKDTYTGVITDMQGDYNIVVPAEGSVLQFSFIGYAIQEVVIGKEKIINVSMVPNTKSIEEVVVTVQTRGQIGARKQQINSNTIKNVVAPDRLQENPDANAAEAIGRLPGVSLLRSGGEGTGLVIRGLEPRYSNVTINGEQMAASNATNRSTGISDISLYSLQGVEVYKSLTADMEANSPAGTVNLKLREAPKGFKSDIMAQFGYNNLNKYFGNYKFAGAISNRFFDNKLGIILSANTERVNRSTHTMSAGYNTYGDSTDLIATSANLNIVNRFIHRSSVNLSLDYQVHPTTKLKFFNQFNYSNVEYERQSKSYGFGGYGGINYSLADNPKNYSNKLHSALSGVTNLDFLNIELDYGVTFAYSQTTNPMTRSWGFGFQGISEQLPVETLLTASAKDLIPNFAKYGDNFAEDAYMTGISRTNSDMEDKNLSTFLNIKVPINIGDKITGYLKFGGKYRKKWRYYDVSSGNQNQHPFLSHYWYENLPWLSALNGDEKLPFTLNGFDVRRENNFLGGAYDYGTIFNTDKLNEVSSWFEDWSAYVLSLPKEERTAIIGTNELNVSYRYDVQGSVINDQDLVENYYAGYLMGEFNFGKWLMFMPGVRLETTDADMNGFFAVQPLYSPSIGKPLPGKDTTATRSDNFLLPMVHLRVKPTNFMYVHLAYTQAISRPDFNSISPNYYADPSGIFRFNSQNPNLRSELWTNYDVQVAFHGKKLGLFSISGFYKAVEDKIWGRTFTRIKGDPKVPYFGEKDAVSLTIRENHPYNINLSGVEVELQTSFWYLPKPFNFFTIYANYTYTQSTTYYPLTRLESVFPPGGGRPTKVRVDTVYSAPMRNQPKHIANASLGFNYKKLNTWVSFQYNGGITQATHQAYTELDIIKEHFYRVDFQATYDFYINRKSKLQLIANFANLTNFVEKQKRREDPRFTNEEAYGWTVDLGVRYRF